MEYVNDAQGKTVVVSSSNASPSAAADAVLAAPAGSNATANASVGGAPVSPASPAPAIITVKGLSSLEEMQDFYQREVTRVEADAAAVKAFAASVLSSGKADIAAVDADAAVVKTLPKTVKVAIAAFVVLMYALGFATGKFL